LVRRRDLGRSLFAAVFSEFIAREKPGRRGLADKETSAGLVRPAAQRGHGPARLDGRTALATVAGMAMNVGKDDRAAEGPGMRRINAARRALLRATGTPDWT
jgi:hypothetical protein